MRDEIPPVSKRGMKYPPASKREMERTQEDYPAMENSGGSELSGSFGDHRMLCCLLFSFCASQIPTSPPEQQKQEEKVFFAKVHFK